MWHCDWMPDRNPTVDDQDVPPRLFCLLSMKRCGSTLLVHLLNSHPQVVCLNQALLTRPGLPPSPGAAGEASRPSPSTFGFKVLEVQNRRWLAQILEDPGVPVILLTRSNPLRHLYSCRMALKSGIYTARPASALIRARARYGLVSLRQKHWPGLLFAIRSLLQLFVSILRGGELYRPESIWIEPSELDRFIEESSSYFASLRHSLRQRGGPWLEMSYESLCGDQQPHTLSTLLAFLRLPHAALTTGTQKLNDKPLAQLIINAAALQQHCVQRGLSVQ
jgi:hypothetical protein